MIKPATSWQRSFLDVSPLDAEYTQFRHSGQNDAAESGKRTEAASSAPEARVFQPVIDRWPVNHQKSEDHRD